MRFPAELAGTVELREPQHAAAVAGSPSGIGAAPWRTLPQDADLGTLRLVHQRHRNLIPPTGECAVDRATPTHTPAIRRIGDRFDPEAPFSETRQAEVRGGEAFGVTRGLTLQRLNLQGLLQIADFSSGRTGLSLHQAAGRPTPRAISVANIGIEAKPISSMLMIQLRRPAKASLTLGSSPLRSGIAQRM